VKLAIDTNGYTLFMQGDPHAITLFREAELLLMPIPVVAELRFGFLGGTKGRSNEAWLTRFLDRPRVRVLHCDDDTAHHFARLKWQLKQQGTPIPINDVWIAALALQHSAILFTRDSDFANIPQLPRR
jgi:tRNA(fMet)-specific endonuclease VapC